MRPVIQILRIAVATIFCAMLCCMESQTGLADSPYTYTDPETGVVYYLPDEVGGAYTWGMELADYRGTILEEMWGRLSPFSVYSVDLNADGNLDLLFVRSREEFNDRTGEIDHRHDLVYCEGDGTGHFDSPKLLVEDVAPLSFVPGDIDHDGILEIVATADKRQDSAYRLLLLCRSSDGSYVSEDLCTDYEFSYVSVADVTGDGNPDIVGMHLLDDLSLQFLTLKGDGEGGFSEPISSVFDQDTPTMTSQVEGMADYNNDRRLDICFSVILLPEDGGPSSNGIITGLGQQDGTFKFVLNQSLGDYLPRTYGASGDFNGDGWMDIAIPHMVEWVWFRTPEERDQLSSLVSIYYNDGAGGLLSETIVDFQIAGTKALAADLDANGMDDLVSFDANGNASVWLGAPSGEPPSVSVYTALSSPNQRTWSPFLGDFNNDGLVDIGSDFMEPILGIRFGDGRGSFGSGWFSPPIDSPTTRLSGLEDFTADFDADGNLDVVQSISTDVSVAFGDGTGRFPDIVPVLYARDMDEWAIAAGDVNGDGADDLLISSYNNPQDGIRLFLGDRSRGLLEANPIGSAEYGWFSNLELLDFDDDGNLDLAYILEGTLDVCLGDGSGGFSLFTSLGGPATLEGPDEAVYGYWLADVDADGSVDIITDAYPFEYRLWLNDGDGYWSLVATHEHLYYPQDLEAWTAAPEWTRIPETRNGFVPDLDGDGVPDTATANGSLLQVELSGKEAGLLKFCAQGHGESVRVLDPIAVDINGDGWLDLITANRNYISVLLNHLGKVQP